MVMSNRSSLFSDEIEVWLNILKLDKTEPIIDIIQQIADALEKVCN